MKLLVARRPEWTMRHIRHTHRAWLAFATLALCSFTVPLVAQRHSFGSSPPTAPPHAPPLPVAVSSGLGALQFVAVNYGVPPPQALTRQLRAEDDRTRAAALSAIGAPNQYMQRGRVAVPHSISLELVPLSNGDDKPDALLTVELDQHIVTAVLSEDDGSWRRIATVWFATPFEDPRTMPSAFVHTVRSLMQHNRYSAVFHGSASGANGDYVENEAQLRIINGQPVIAISFASFERRCAPVITGTRAASPAGCTVTKRWFQADPVDPYRIFLLVSASGRISQQDLSSAVGASSDFQLTHVRNISCQRFIYSETTLHFEVSAQPGPCPAR